MQVILSYGMGVDSTVILDRWLNEPSSRDFSLQELTVLTAQTGSEFADTRELVERYILPQMRAQEVRYVQVARAGNLKVAGYTVLSDTREPYRLHIEGAYKLKDELLEAGTVPAVQNRRCSTKGKGRPNDGWLGDNVVGAFRHVMGFNADERKRVERDSCYGGDARSAEYPLMTWGWGREQCERYLEDRFGVKWAKSACCFCPFARGKPEVLERFVRHPEALAEALYLEHVSLALNPLMTLYAAGSLRSKLGAEHAEGLRQFGDMVAKTAHALYRVRRVMKKKGSADRSVDVMKTGTQQEMEVALAEVAEREGIELVEEAGILRCYSRRREPGVYPTAEEMWVAAPAEAREKAKASFSKTWQRMSLPTLTW